MALIKTYLDSGVLIAAYHGFDELSLKAMSIIDDKNRQFISSYFVKLEVLSKAIYHKQNSEISFYEAFFTNCVLWANDLEQIVQLAQELANKYGINALDALHIASAISSNANEFVTTEKLTKPLHRVQEIKTISINL